MKRKNIKLLAIVLTMILFVVGCNKTSTENEVVKNNIQESNYIHLTMLYPDTINPVLNTDKSVSYIMNLIYDPLFEIDENYNIKERLVDNYLVSQDGKIVNINLLDNAIWHDGSQITSSDVDFTINLIKNNETSPYYDLVSNIKSIKIKNQKNFEIELNEKDPFIIDRLTFPIVSKKNLGSLKKEAIKESKNNLIGNGPYKIKEYVDRQYIILEKNSDYSSEMDGNGKDIYVKMVPDKESQTEMVLSLDSDIASISLGQLSKFEDKEEFNTTSYQGRDYEMVVFNFDNDYLKNVNFRKAIIASIDREKIFKDAYVNNGSLSTFPLNTTSIYYDSEVKSIAYNKENAQTYLKKGLVTIAKNLNIDTAKDEEDNSKSDLIIEDNNVNGNANIQISQAEKKALLGDLDLKIIVSKDNEVRKKVASMIKDYLKVLGVKSTIEELNTEDMIKSINSKDYDLAIVGYSLSSVPDATSILNSLDTKDSKLNAYLTELSQSTSKEETKKIYSKIQDRVTSHASFISLGILNNFIVNNQRLEGIIHPNDFDIYKGISNLKMSK